LIRTTPPRADEQCLSEATRDESPAAHSIIGVATLAQYRDTHRVGGGSSGSFASPDQGRGKRLLESGSHDEGEEGSDSEDDDSASGEFEPAHKEFRSSLGPASSTVGCSTGGRGRGASGRGGRGGRGGRSVGSGQGSGAGSRSGGIGTGAGGVSGMTLFSAGDPAAVVRQLRHAYALVQANSRKPAGNIARL
jgi:hypothetical protein